MYTKWLIVRDNTFDTKTNVFELEGGTEDDARRVALQLIRDDKKKYASQFEDYEGSEKIGDFMRRNGQLQAYLEFFKENHSYMIKYNLIPQKEISVINPNYLSLDTLLEEDEIIMEFVLESNMYVPYHFIMKKDSTDLSAALEDTLHRLLEVGATDDIINNIMGAVRYDTLHEKEEAIYIDLDFVLPGNILSMSN